MFVVWGTLIPNKTLIHMLSYVQVPSGILCITSTYGIKFISFCNNPSVQIPSWLMCFLPKNKKEEDISTQKSNEPKSNPTPIHVLPTFIKNKNILVMQMDMP